MPSAMTSWEAVIFEGRDLILQVTKCCQCRHRIATSLKDSFTFGAREADEPNLQSNNPAREATTQPAKRLPLEANDPARGATTPRSQRSSPRSGRQHRAWGASPRIKIRKAIEPAKRATAQSIYTLSPASRARTYLLVRDPGAGAPGFMLSPASRACVRRMLSPLRGLS